MTQQPDSSVLNGHEAAATPRSAQDLQRGALRDLVALAGECAAREIEIERHRQAALAGTETELKTALKEIEQRRGELAAELEQKYGQFRTQIEAQFNADLERLTTTGNVTRRRLESEAANVEREVKQQFAQATWLAETLLEGVQKQLTVDARQAQEEFEARRELLDMLEQQGAGWAHRYGLPWPEETEAAAPSSEAADAAAPPDFNTQYQQADQALLNLTSLRLARFFVGAMPFMVLLLIVATAAGAVQLLSQSTVPQWRAMSIAGGIGLAVALAAGVVLKRAAKAQAAAAAETFVRLFQQASTSARLAFDFAAKRRQQLQTQAVDKRNAEVQSAKDRYAPILTRSVHGRTEGLKSVGEEHDRLLPKIHEQRERAQREADEWRQTHTQELERGYQNELQGAQGRHDRQIEAIERECREGRSALEHRWGEGLAAIQEPIDRGASSGGQRFLPWEDIAWQNWSPPRTFASVVPFGQMRVDLPQITDKIPRGLQLPEMFSVPAMLAFPKQASLLIDADAGGRVPAIRTLQAIMLRLLTCVPPGRVRFTIIDPVGLGQNFAGFMHLADYDEALVGGRIWTDREHIEARLSDLTEHMETVIQKYLRNEFATIDDYNAQAGELAEPYRFLVISDFPAGFTEESVQRLGSIITTGPRCGVYTLVFRDLRQAIPPGTPIDELQSHSVHLVQRGLARSRAAGSVPHAAPLNGAASPQREFAGFIWDDEVFKRFPLALDEPPAEDFLTRILHVVGRQARESKRVEVPFETIAPPADQVWSGSTSEDVRVPIGRMGATRLQTLRLGRGVAQHALIAGKTGSGKSTLLHVLITNLSLWYSPDEVEFYLVDFKKGVEFKAYATHGLPHARAIAVESDREFGLSVLQRMDAELTRRGAVFRKLGVQDLPSYRATCKEPMPRTLLIIDEFQEFFSEDDKLAQDAGLLLDRLVRQGRAFGIHVLLGSQTIGGTSGLARSTIGQMAVRIALQTSEADSQIILGDGNSAARLLSRPGEAVYNDAGGLVEGNSPFQVAWLPDEQRERFLTRVRERADGSSSRGEAVVFEGNVPADLRKNAALTQLISGPRRPPQTLAPRAWLGEPVAIKEPTAVTFRRQSGANLLIIGQQDEPAMALLASSMISLAAQLPRDAVSFYVLDGSATDSPLARVMPQLRERLPQIVKLVEYRAVPEALAELSAELQRRQEGGETNPPAIFCVIYGLQRYRALRKQDDAFMFSGGGSDAATPPDRQFADLLREGPPLGIHVLAWADTPAAVERTLDRSSLREFDNRVLFQMSASDSSNLIDSPLANKLGPNRALAYSEEQGTLEKFRPYALPDATWLAEVARDLPGGRQ